LKIRYFLYNSFLIENGSNKIAIDPGQYFSIFNFTSLIPKADWKSITHILITHGDPDHHRQSDRVAKASNAPVVCGKDLARVEDGKTLLVDPRGKELTSWVPFAKAHPLDIGESVTLYETSNTLSKAVAIPFWNVRDHFTLAQIDVKTCDRRRAMFERCDNKQPSICRSANREGILVPKTSQQLRNGFGMSND
jgi:L-ascorbate metabolism protein UlaG (beta-lactamase superfamily)